MFADSDAILFGEMANLILYLWLLNAKGLLQFYLFLAILLCIQTNLFWRSCELIMQEHKMKIKNEYLQNVSITLKIVKKVITNLDSSTVAVLDCIPALILRNCQYELL